MGISVGLDPASDDNNTDNQTERKQRKERTERHIFRADNAPGMGTFDAV